MPIEGHPVQDPRPRGRQIAADLRAEIMSDDLKPGASLPPIRVLMERYDAASTTIRHAQKILKDEGFLGSRRGADVYVLDRKPLAVRVGSYFATGPGGWSYTLLRVGEEKPPADVAAALGLDPETGTAMLRLRLSNLAGEPVDLSWSYYPLDLVAPEAGRPLAERKKIRGGAPAVLASLGHPERSFRDRVSSRLPTTEEFQFLELPSGEVPVLRQFRVCSSDTRIVWAAVLIKGAHRYELEYDETITEI